MKTISSILLAALVLAGCTQAPPPVDLGVIVARSEAWETAVNAGDMDALVELYAADARLMPPNGETVIGHDGVRAVFGPFLDAGLTVQLTSVETQAVGDGAYNVGTYVVSDGDQVVDTGKYVETWAQAEDGAWRYTNDIWNSDLPVPTPEEADVGMEVMIVHEVADGDHWMDAWRGESGRRQLFLANGATKVETFRSAVDPNLTGLVVRISDMDAFNAMLASDEGAAAAAADGVDLNNMEMLIKTE
jgi:uncharacterized protein (TIGR02246 family)